MGLAWSKIPFKSYPWQQQLAMGWVAYECIRGATWQRVLSRPGLRSHTSAPHHITVKFHFSIYVYGLCVGFESPT